MAHQSNRPHEHFRTPAGAQPAGTEGFDELLFADRPVITTSEEEMLCDDICMLCESCLKNSNGHALPGVQLDIRPGSRRWQKLPCLCPDRYLHVSCLETAFFDSSVRRASGRRMLRLTCPVCRTGLRVNRQRGRRTCDHQACMSFCRHLLSVLLIAAFLIAFGIWSIFYNGRLTPNPVNIGLIAIGGVILLVFAVYEICLLHGRFEFVIVRLANQPAQMAAVDTEGPPAVAHCNPTTVQA